MRPRFETKPDIKFIKMNNNNKNCTVTCSNWLSFGVKSVSTYTLAKSLCVCHHHHKKKNIKVFAWKYDHLNRVELYKASHSVQHLVYTHFNLNNWIYFNWNLNKITITTQKRQHSTLECSSFSDNVYIF